MAFVAISAGCYNQPEKIETIRLSFTNDVAFVKSTSLTQMFIVKCSDGSIWEVQVNDGGIITYKNCLFDSTIPPKQPILEKP